MRRISAVDGDKVAALITQTDNFAKLSFFWHCEADAFPRATQAYEFDLLGPEMRGFLGRHRQTRLILAPETAGSGLG